MILFGVSGLFLSLASVRANVYATNIKLNSHAHTAVVAVGNPLAINYILNEPASAGVSVQIFSGTNLIRTITVTNGQSGTMRGTNAVIWDGNDDQTNVVTSGFYSVSITAAANGYTQWTQITDDLNPGNAVFEPRGIAINQNSKSPYYGRVFVGNAPTPESANTVDPSHEVGILKLNTDGSPADEGIFSTGGYGWSGNKLSPWKIAISADDKVYINDWSGNGMVMAFDQLITTNNYLTVLRADNLPRDGAGDMSGPFVSGSGTNTQIWMADVSVNAGPSAGIVRWTVTADGTLATNDEGTVIIPITSSNLTVAPWDVTVDGQGNIYTIQRRDDYADLENRVFRFPAYGESGQPPLNMDWAIGSEDDTLINAYGIAVNPAGTYVSVATRGYGPGQLGGVTIFDAPTGTEITNIVAEADGQHTDTAWDNVGNMYETDLAARVWRAYSPPGTNQATTVGTSLIQVIDAYTPPVLTNFVPCLTNFHATLLGQSNVTYLIESSSNLFDWTILATNYSAEVARSIRLGSDGSTRYYRARVKLQP